MSSCLVADIGGTNGRFAIFSEGRLCEFQSFKCANFETFEALIEHYIDQLNMPLPQQAVIAIATYVNDDYVEFTNLSWTFRVTELAKRYDLKYLKVFNDFTAVSISIPSLDPNQLIQVGGIAAHRTSAKAVIGAGTGLGVSGLLPYDGIWVPIQGQGGHVMYGPHDELEKSLFEFIHREHDYVSAEYLLSGRGLELLYQSVAYVNGTKAETYTPADIVSHALNQNSSICLQTLEVFSKILGSVASDLVLTLGAQGGLYIGGGIVNHMIDFFTGTDHFRTRFEQKGRMTSYIKEIPTYVISEKNVGLLGALECRKPSYETIGVTCKR